VQKLKNFINRYMFSEDLSLDARMTNMVCVVGIAGTIVAIITRLFMHSSPALILVLSGIVVSVLCLFAFCNKYRKHEIGMYMVLFLLCDVLLPMSLFAMGSVKSGVAAYFTMSIVIIVFLSNGLPRVIVLITHIVLVISCYAASSMPPFNAFVTELSGTAQYLDHIQSFVVAGLFIAAIVVFQQRILFNEKNKVNMLFHSVSAMAVALLDLNVDAPDDALHEGVTMMARSVGVDRVYVCKNSVQNGRLVYMQIFQWLDEGVKPRAAFRGERWDQGKHAYDEFFFMGAEVFAREQFVYVPTAQNSAVWADRQEIRKYLFLDCGIHSIFLVPVFFHEQFWGFVCFDICRSRRLFSEDEQRILHSGSLLIANAIIRTEVIQALEGARKGADAASRSKSEFLANMSHEIRTPLNAIVGMTAIGQSASSVEQAAYAFGKIQVASKHLLGVINDILDMSKIEANKLELSFAEFNFEKMLRNVVNVSNFRVEEKQQNFTVHIDKNIPRALIGDDQRLAQVITNLLSNAVKFTPEKGAISLNTQLEGEENGLCTIRIVVTDSGIGISSEQQAKLFTSFQQAESGTSRKFGGTGLGLAISKRIVEMMGGRIWIESEPGKGATFAFTVQMRRGADEQQRLLDPGVNLKNIRVLVVDDAPEILEHFVEIAGALGIACDTASGGGEACSLVEQNGAYDIYFVDWKMPGMDGIELSRLLKSRDGKKSVVIMISSTEWSVIADKAKAAGVDKFLPKPLFPSAIADCINECLGVGGQGIPDNEGTEISDLSAYRVLLAEDVEINREIVLVLLEPTKLAIDCAENGREVLRLFCENPGAYDMIFMDVQMPEMDGYEATRKIRALGHISNAKTIPIIAMTANVFREDIERCLEAGMNDHIGKPLDLHEVLVKLRKYLP
jgi:signal transduction histidine kinase/DNA-binding response OmpR family regulator